MHDDPIFQDAGHALHVSFLIHSLPATQASPTAIVINQLVKQNHVWDELPPPQARRVNFRGLSPLEVRGQCAQVVGMVEHHLHPAERDAVKAIYGRQVIKAAGVRGVAGYCEPMLGHSPDCCLYLAWHVFMEPQQRKGVTLAEIAEKFGASNEAMQYGARLLRKSGQTFHARALSLLAERFERGGLIPESSTA
jgi:hypothetical protein